MHASSLVTCLERPFRDYKPTDASVRDVLLMGLRWPTPFWPGLAVGWLEQGAPLDAEIADCLGEIAGRSKWPQRLRHRAQELRSAWLRASHGGSKTSAEIEE